MKYADQRCKVLSVLFIVALQCNAGFGQTNPVSSIIKSKLLDTTQPIIVLKDTLYAQSLLQPFYNYSDGEPVWLDYISRPKRFRKLMEIIERSSYEGLTPSHYHLAKIKNSLQNNYTDLHKHPSMQAELDLLLSDAFLTLAFHYHLGRTRDIEMNCEWECFFGEINLPNILWKALQADTLEQALMSFHPRYKQYHDLQKAMVGYKNATLLYPDSISLQKDMDKIAVNMERWRWLPKSPDSMYIIVNIPQFRLWLYRNDTIVMTMKTIVGKRSNPTPSFNCTVSYLVLRPRWNIPTSIMKNELLPKVLKDTSYLAKNHYRILNTWKDNDSNYILPNTIYWDTTTVEAFPYKLVQLAGHWNPLGMIKLMFPNQFNVYLHDTPDRSLFDKPMRTFSHGCIRLEKAGELAAYITQNDSLLSFENYSVWFKENQRKKLDYQVPLSINYWTAWIGDNGIFFFEDIYRRDILLEKAMKQRPSLF